MALLNFHLVNWKTVGQLIQPWGLGIQSMVCFNQALLVKWLWRFTTERRQFVVMLLL